MLLEEVNIHHTGAYDFFYLPIDFKNRCNVGYCFVNFIDPKSIPAFVEEFVGQRWKSFNSEKVCTITYARIQGKHAMISRFQNSSLLEKDAEYKPLLFYSSGPDMGKPEPFPSSTRMLNTVSSVNNSNNIPSNGVSGVMGGGGGGGYVQGQPPVKQPTPAASSTQQQQQQFMGGPPMPTMMATNPHLASYLPNNSTTTSASSASMPPPPPGMMMIPHQLALQTNGGYHPHHHQLHSSTTNTNSNTNAIPPAPGLLAVIHEETPTGITTSNSVSPTTNTIATTAGGL